MSPDDAHPVFQALEQDLPPREFWPTWIADRHIDTRARIARGDDDSLVNLLLFGSSFTKHPRITLRQLDEIRRQSGSHSRAESRINQLLAGRLDDLQRAIARAATAGDNERLLFARRILEGEKEVKEYLVSAVVARLREEEGYSRAVRSAGALNDPSLEFAERSRLYRTRGLSSDTSLRTNFAVEEALKELKSHGILKPGLKRIAIVGPGLDFTDKQEGHDFYPVQTIQPFALTDSLLRLGLATADDITLMTFDLSARVNDHLERVREGAERDEGYVVHLPLDAHISWTPQLLRYWHSFGEHIGTPAKPAAIPVTAGDVRLRAVAMRPLFASRITAVDANIVLQHLGLPENERFDLIVGTNIFVYYDRLEQGLAMVNIAKMMAPGAILLSNNALLELPSTRLRSVGYSKTLYSEREEDGDVMVWYQLKARQ